MAMPRIILIMLILNLLLTTGGLGLGYFAFTSIASGAGFAGVAQQRGPKNSEQQDQMLFPIEKIIVSVPEGGREHYFVLDLVLLAPGDTETEKLEKIDPMIRNSVISSLSAVPFSELRAMHISELQMTLDEALRDYFAGRKMAVPFANVLVSKLVVQ